MDNHKTTPNLAIDHTLPIDGWRFNYIKRVYDNEAIVAFIDLLGTKQFYCGQLPSEDQAKSIFNSLIYRFANVFDNYFKTNTIRKHFDISIFGDSIVISMRIKNEPLIEQLLEFLLEFQFDLLINGYIASRAVLTKRFFFLF